MSIRVACTGIRRLLKNLICRVSADSDLHANLTNLALKGIIGVKAMAEISRVVGENDDAHAYDVCLSRLSPVHGELRGIQSRASQLIQSWQSLALSSDQSHLLRSYGDQQSWALIYNMYSDKLLGTNLVSQSVREFICYETGSLKLTRLTGYRHPN